VLINRPAVRSAPPSLHRRLTGFTLVVTLLVANASALVHQLTARHAVCAEHGEIIEVTAAGEQALHHTGSQATPVMDGEARSEAAHEHCDVLAELRTRLTPPEHSHSVAIPRPVLASAVQSSQHLAELRQLYRLAPKSGPPALT